MHFINNKIDNIKKTLITSWRHKFGIIWTTISILFIFINLIFFLIAIGFRDIQECIKNFNFDLPEWLLMSTGINLTMILGSLMINHIDNPGFWLNIFNIIYQMIFIGWLLLDSIIGILLITFSNTNCTDKPEPLFILCLLYFLINNMCGFVFIVIYTISLFFTAINQYNNRRSILDDLIV